MKFGNVRNVFGLLAQREVAPRTKHSSKRLLGETARKCSGSFSQIFEAGRDARRGLASWWFPDFLFPFLILMHATVSESFFHFRWLNLLWFLGIWLHFSDLNLLHCIQGRSRIITPFKTQILSTVSSSKVNYSSSLQSRWQDTCFYTVSYDLFS